MLRVRAEAVLINRGEEMRTSITSLKSMTIVPATKDVLEAYNWKKKQEARDRDTDKEYKPTKRLHRSSLMGPLLEELAERRRKVDKAIKELPDGVLAHLKKVIKGEVSNSKKKFKEYMVQFKANLGKKRRNRRTAGGIFITALLGGRITVSKLKSKEHRDELLAELTVRHIDHVKTANWYSLTQELKKHELGRLVKEEKVGSAASWKDIKLFEPIADEMKLLLGIG